MLRLLLMGKQEQEKHTPWRGKMDLEMMTMASFLEPLKIFLTVSVLCVYLTTDIQSFNNSNKHKTKFLRRASYLQIYNDSISYLLTPVRNNLIIREGGKKGVFVENLSEFVVKTPQDIYTLMERGAQIRATGSTRLNELSSRSHAVFIIIFDHSETKYVDEHGREVEEEELEHTNAEVRQAFKIGKLNLVDLAGSE